MGARQEPSIFTSVEFDSNDVLEFQRLDRSVLLFDQGYHLDHHANMYTWGMGIMEGINVEQIRRGSCIEFDFSKALVVHLNRNASTAKKRHQEIDSSPKVRLLSNSSIRIHWAVMPKILLPLTP